jgi:tetratricopeptide (TPR) repeat protein
MKTWLFYLAATLVGPIAWAQNSAPVAPATPGAIAQNSNTVAVADFELAGDGAQGGDWAFGLADLLAAELQQRGVALFERSQIRLVLGERRLSASGLMQLRAAPAGEIPDLQYLVTGTIRSLTNRQFHLEVSLVEAASGRNVASFSREGAYPEAVAGALVGLAEQVASRLKSAGAAPGPQRAAGSHLTHTPEVSLLFYKGIACCLAGQPEMGVSWFIDTLAAAPDFLPARLWTLRAFEMLGLPQFAALARAKVQAAAGGQGVLNRLKESPFLDKKLVPVAIIPDLQLEGAGLQLAAALKTELGRYTNLFVSDPANIQSLAAEMDLQLTEKAGHELELASVLWSAVDALVFLRPAGEAGGSMVQVELRDAMSGETIYRSQTPRDGAKLASLSGDLAKQVSARRKAGVPETVRVGASAGRATKPPQVINTDRIEFAGLLKYLAENPSDRRAWMRLAWFARWLNAPEGGRYYGGCYESAISDCILAATKPTDSDAATWTADALWHRRHYEDENPPPIAVEFAPLLERYPASPEAQNVRSALAMECLDQKNYAEAARIFLKLAEDLPHLPPGVKVGPDYWANFYFFTGVTLHQLGDDARARQFVSQAAEVLRTNQDVGLLPFSLGVRWRNPFPQRHPWFGPELDLRQGVVAWEARLNPAIVADKKKPLTLEQLELLLNEAKQARGSEAAPEQLEYLRRLIECKQLNPTLFQGRIDNGFSPKPGTYREVNVWHQGPTYGYFSLMGKLVLEAIVLLNQQAAASPQDPGEVRQLAQALADGLDAPIAANIFEAVGDKQQALQQVEKAIRSPAPFPRERFGMHPTPQQYEARELRQQKIRLLQALGRAAEAAEYARTRLHQADVDASLAATVDAAEAYKAIERPDEACRLLADFVRAQEPGGEMNKQSAIARFWWAEYEDGRGNVFEATELLRQVVQHSESKGWDGYLRYGYVRSYEEAVSRLAKLRAQAKFPVASADWEDPTRLTAGAVDIEAPEPSDMQRDLDALLRGTRDGTNHTSYGGAQVGVFVKKYGHAAVPAIVKAAAPGGFHAQLIAEFKLLDHLATPEDAPLVLAAFKTAPPLALVAFHLDRTNAAAILRERFAIYARGGEIPRELRSALEKYHLKDQYPVLVANLAAKDINGNTARDATAVDRLFRKGASPELRESFRAALASVIAKELRMGYQYGLAGVSETALRNGVAQGIEAALRSENPGSTNNLTQLRKYMALPADNAAALAMVQSGLGRWQWDETSGKWVLGEAASPGQASAQSASKRP